ncbi:FAD-dependent oxidoreductase [Methylocapsa sp. S129]|uniref:FAD-dependent oxidoreductase n=1 Tax=Methylocapsa sp. S129 TaxID=1641869 RepID=UPI00131EB811|nr:FAD-binding protein [Methylocapsa sp. S129]
MANAAGDDLEADVLIIGGGVAGTWAAIAAAREGASVILADKGYCGASGVAATAGPGHWWVPPDQRAQAIERRLATCGGLGDRDWMARILDLTWRTLPTLAPYYRFPKDENGVTQFRALRGPEYLRAMRMIVIDHGVTILDQSPALELLRRADGSIVGARGRQRQRHSAWSVRAGAVVLATGGYAFKSRLLGGQTNTGDGHLMAAEAGAEMSGLEFSNFYSIAPARTSMTRSMSYAFARYFDADGRELDIPPGPDNTRDLGRALLQGPLFCRLDRMPEDIRARLSRISPNVPLTFDRLGVDPFKDRFEVTLTAEGTVRGAGGLRILGEDCATNVEGLFAAGDVATRELVAGAMSGGGAVNSSWALSSGQWAGRGAARLAKQLGRRADAPTQAIGEVGLRPKERARDLDPRDIIRQAQKEMLPCDKNLFRFGPTLSASLSRLDRLWEDLRNGLACSGDRAIAAREAAAIVATSRWTYAAALGRDESRGMHVREDTPDEKDGYARRLNVGGLDKIWTKFEADCFSEAAQ